MRLPLIAPYVLLASVIILYVNERSRRISLEATVADNPVMSTSIPDNAPQEEAIPTPMPTATSAPESTSASIQQHSSAEPSYSDERSASATWRADQQLRRISKFISLNSVQKDQLRAALARQQESQYSEEPRLDGEVRNLLGDDLVNQYEELSNLEAKEEERQRLEREAIILGRQLSLSSEQEGRVTGLLKERADVLSGERAKVETRSTELMTKHFETNATKEDLRKGYEEIRGLQGELKEKERAYLAERLKGVLTPEQYERWASLEAAKQAE